MKGKILLAFGLVALGGLNYYVNNFSPVTVLNLDLANTEAMAQSESSPQSMVLKNVVPTFCKVCVDGGNGCNVSDQCCVSWGNCPW